MSCARSAAAGRPPAAPSPSSRRFRTSFSCRDRERDRNVEAERVAAEEETDGPADATHFELALQRRAGRRRTAMRCSGARQSSRRAASTSFATASARVGCRSAFSSASSAMLPPARKRPALGARRQVGELVELEREAQAEHDEHVDRVVLARDQLAQRVGVRPRSSQSLRRDDRAWRAVRACSSAARSSVRSYSGQASASARALGGIGQPPGDEQVDGPRELLLARDLLRRGPAERTERDDVREHLLRRLAADPSAQQREQVVQVEAGEQQVDELATAAPRRRRAARRACAPGAGRARRAARACRR